MGFHRRFVAVALAVLGGALVAACASGSSGASPTETAAGSPAITAGPVPSRPTFPPAPTPALGDFPLGTYTTTLTRDDVKNAGFPSEHDMDENAGFFTLDVNDDGTWRFVQTSNVPLENPVFQGTFAVDGDQIAFRVIEPLEFNTEVDTVTWKLIGKTMLFTWVGPDQGLSTLIWTKHPWTKQ